MSRRVNTAGVPLLLYGPATERPLTIIILLPARLAPLHYRPHLSRIPRPARIPQRTSIPARLTQLPS